MKLNLHDIRRRQDCSCCWCNRRIILSILITLVILWFLISFHYYTIPTLKSYKLKGPPPPEIPAGGSLDYEHFRQACAVNKSDGMSIDKIYTTIKQLRDSRIPACEDFLRIFDRILTIEEVIGEVTLPDQFIPQVRSWLGNKENVFQQIYRQKIYTVVSHLSHDQSVYNTLRSKRPVSSSGVDPIAYVEELVNSTSANCDFCHYQNHTASDVFGRIVSQYSASASNTFKLAKFHGLFFPLSHHPLHLNHSVLLDMFVTTTNRWFKTAFEFDSSHRYPSLLWDSLPHGGASQVHPHVHGLLSDKHYAGAFEVLHSSAKEYYEITGRFLWPDFIQIHQFLGLCVEEGSAVAIVPISARKDHEYWIVAEELNKDVVNLIDRVITAYSTRLNVFCHSAGGALPLLDSSSPTLRLRNGLPFILRIGSRGDCTSVRSDISSLELYTVNNINSDLAQTISALRETPSRDSA